MFQLWAKAFSNNHLIKDTTIADGSDDTRTAKVFHAITQVCQQFDLSEPIWLDSNIRDFQRRSKTRFSKDNFIDEIDFDYLEIQILEEDY